jgi:hypothetical protein
MMYKLRTMPPIGSRSLQPSLYPTQGKARDMALNQTDQDPDGVQAISSDSSLGETFDLTVILRVLSERFDRG